MAEKGSGSKSVDTTPAQLSDLICCSAADLEHYLCEFILSGSREITFLLSGKTGVGKSHLTNALIGEELAEEGEELDPQTDDVTPYDFVKNDVKMTVFDTPGLADGTGNDEKYLKQIKKKVKTVDLFLFCFDMTSTRFRDDDTWTIRKLTRTFGISLWDHALVVLTFANKVQPSKDNVTEKDFFQKRIRLFRDKICEMLREEEVYEKALDDLPFVPAGEWMRPTLPDRDNWLTAFWIEAFRRIDRNAKAAFLIANIDRITISFGGDLLDLTSETHQGEREGFDECSKEETFSVRGGLEKSSPVISRRNGKYYRKMRGRIKAKQMTPTTITNSDNSVDDDHVSESILQRESALVSTEVEERFQARMRKRNVQGPRDEKIFGEKYLQNSYGKSASSFGYDINDNSLGQSGRTSITKLETERQTKSPHYCVKAFSLPPSYDEAVRNPVPLPMDEYCSQDLFKEIAKEALHDYKPGNNAGARDSQSSFVKIYVRLFRKTIEFIKRLLRGKQNEKLKCRGTCV